jgi:hypothetical protein
MFSSDEDCLSSFESVEVQWSFQEDLLIPSEKVLYEIDDKR